MSAPRLSIIIPTLNEERDLPTLLDSLDTQEFRDFEVIIADAKSPDTTREIATSRGCRIVDGGLPGIGRNLGAEVALGELLLFLDADVILEENFLTQTLKEFDERNLDIATCPAVPIGNHVGDAFMLSAYNAYMLMTQHIWPHAPGFCILIKNELHKAMGGFDEGVLLVEDADYAKRAGRRGQFGILVTTRIPVSTRRFENDGRFLTSLKYITWDLHRALFGEVRDDVFSYKFGHHYDEGITDHKIWAQSPKELARKYKDFIKKQRSLFD